MDGFTCLLKVSYLPLNFVTHITIFSSVKIFLFAVCDNIPFSVLGQWFKSWWIYVSCSIDNSRVVEHDVWWPYIFLYKFDLSYTIIFVRVPHQVLILPLLWKYQYIITLVIPLLIINIEVQYASKTKIEKFETSLLRPTVNSRIKNCNLLIHPALKDF